MYRYGSMLSIVRIRDGMWIPDSGNSDDTIEYLQWLAEGNTPLPEATYWDAQMNYRSMIAGNEIGGVMKAIGFDGFEMAWAFFASKDNVYQEKARRFIQFMADVYSVWLEFDVLLKQAYEEGTPPPLTHEEFKATLPVFSLEG